MNCYKDVAMDLEEFTFRQRPLNVCLVPVLCKQSLLFAGFCIIGGVTERGEPPTWHTKCKNWVPFSRHSDV